MDDLTFELEEAETTEEEASIKRIFDAANDSVKSATQIFDKCVALKNKLEAEKKEILKEQKKLENANKDEYLKIAKFKDEAYKALKEKKKELDSLAEAIKQRELELANERARFEIEKKKTYETIRKKEEENKKSILDKNKELDKRKKELDKQEKDIEKQRIDADKTTKELEANLAKFNDVVKQFTSGVGELL